jgi:hypothetical protein
MFALSVNSTLVTYLIIFHPTPIFAHKTGAYPSGATYEALPV